MPSLGEELRAARESRRLSIPDVSEQIHIRSVYLQAIEEENWSSIAAPVYVRGFIRTYARFLGLGAEDAVARFNGVVVEPKPEVRPDPQIFPPRGSAPPRGLWAGCVAAAALLVFFVGYNYYRLQKSTQAAILAEAVVPTPPPALARGETTPRVEPSKVGSGAKGFSFRLEERSWLRVVVDGRVVLEGVFEPGTRRAFEGKAATVRAGNAGGVAVTIDGKEIGMLGSPGDVVERTFTSTQKQR
jgi:hypothetical protein